MNSPFEYQESLNSLHFTEEEKAAIARRAAEAARKQTRPARRPVRRIALIAAAAVLVLAVGTAGATGILRSAAEVFSPLFGGAPAQTEIIDKIGYPVGASDTDNGVTVTARKPNAQEMADLRFAWAVEAGVTSNSVIFARNGATVAIGTGEQDRVGCVELAIHKAYTKYADTLAFREHNLSFYELKQKAATDAALKAALDDIQARTQEARGGLPGTVLISDGFFPFRDGVDAAMAQGVTAIGQPGGSMRDTEVIAACNEASPQVAMVFTGQRSFKH